MKRYISLLIFAIFAFLLISCSDSQSSGNATDTDSENNGDSIQTTAESEKKDNLPLTEEYLRSYKVAPASDFEYKLRADGYHITAYIGEDDVVVIPKEIDGTPVISIAKLVFANKSNVRGVLIPDTIKSLDSTFGNNKSIEIVICEGVENMGPNVFNSCSNIKQIILGDSLTTIGECSFFSCKSLKEIYLAPTFVDISESIAPAVFFGCKQLTIVGEAGSYAETFAQEQGINFRAK